MHRYLFFLAIIFALFSVSLSVPALAESTDEQWKGLLSAVNEEDWKSGYKLSVDLLKDLQENDDRLPRLRYMYLYTAAGKVSQGKMTFEELETAVKPMVGKYVVFPYRPLTIDSHGSPLNFISGDKSDKKKLFTVATNQDGTTVHAFEYITLKNDFELEEHDGEPASVSGTIEKIEPNPNKSQAIVLRVYVIDAELSLKNKRDFHPTKKTH